MADRFICDAQTPLHISKHGDYTKYSCVLRASPSDIKTDIEKKIMSRQITNSQDKVKTNEISLSKHLIDMKAHNNHRVSVLKP